MSLVLGSFKGAESPRKNHSFKSLTSWVLKEFSYDHSKTGFNAWAVGLAVRFPSCEEFVSVSLPLEDRTRIREA